MICPQCHGSVDGKAAECSHCGAALVPSIQCRHCKAENRPNGKFCDQCGHPLEPVADSPADPLKSERKHVTVLFSDISRYREIFDRLDPEDIREVTRHLFEEMVKIISRYEGYVDRILWDGVLAVFGMPRAHEDDAIRALRAAMDIQRMVSRLERRYADWIGGALAMRSGVATGLVVTGSTEEKTGRHGITGDTVNLAARLRDLAAPGEVLADSSAFSAAAGFFTFQPHPPVMIKGRAQSVLVYRVQSATPQPDKVRRVHGLKARLIGRDRELKQLKDAALRLRRKEGTVITVSGDAGTGKSRLITEFKDSADAEDFRWLDGHAYAYNRGIPYFPFIDMLNRRFGIHEEDAEAVIEAKLQSGIGSLMDDPDAVVPFLAGLYALSSPEALAAGPEIFKSRLQVAFITLLSALARQRPTIVCIEDLHWADPSSLALIRFLLKESGLPILFVISYRPTLDFPDGEHGEPFSYARENIRLTDLDAPSSREMVRSLMDTPAIPEALDRYIVNNVEGNPFYLEEVVNSLIDAKRLRRYGSQWHLDESFDISDFSSTINGIIHGRLDRLGSTAKTILQEASVIGRVFRLDLLARITAFPGEFESSLEKIERVDLIRRIPDQSEPTYSFKHAMVQEVVYHSLLKPDRRAIHEKVAGTLETLHHGRLESALETLALHYANSDCTHKAAEYLIRSGEKSLEKYAVEESHGYYERAYRLLNRIAAPTAVELAMLIDLIIKWYFAFNKRGLFREMLDLLRSHEAAVQAFGDPLRTGMYEVCMGWALQRRELVTESYTYLTRALAIGTALGDDNLIGYSSAGLCWTCTDLGRMDEALAYGRQAATVADRIQTDHELIRFNLTGMGLLHFFSGDINACWKTGEQLLQFGEAKGDARPFSEGYLLMGAARMAAGDFVQAESLLNKAIEVSVDPIYSLNARFFLSYAYFSQGKVPIAAQTLEAVIATTEQFGYEYVGTSANAFYGIVSAAMGNLAKGVAIIRERIQTHRQRGKRNHDLIFTHMLGKFYLSLALRQGTSSFSTVIKNAGFLLRTLPVASRLAERYLREAIEIGTQIGTRLRLAQACLDLGLLYGHKKRFTDARNYIARSIDLFDRCGADMLLAEARTALDSLPR
ncbi:MAG: AAA family ATPase [Desulfobacteraceae bacterium]|nr:AAA family ATPase [Desulfobacteraceae bacterium]